MNKFLEKLKKFLTPDFTPNQWIKDNVALPNQAEKPKSWSEERWETFKKWRITCFRCRKVFPEGTLLFKGARFNSNPYCKRCFWLDIFETIFWAFIAFTGFVLLSILILYFYK